MQVRILVLGTKEVKFEDAQKQPVEGLRVHYAVEGGQPHEGVKGFAPVSAFLKGGAAKDLIKAVPGFYQGEFEVGVKDNKPDLKLMNLAFEAPATISSAPAAKAS